MCNLSRFKLSRTIIGLTLAATLANLVAGPAMAGDIDPQHLCASLTPVLKSANETTPFNSLSARTKDGDSFGIFAALAGLGMESGKTCRSYIAGGLGGNRGHGEWNYAECTLSYTQTEGVMDKAPLFASRDALAEQLKTCPELKDWTYSAARDDFSYGQFDNIFTQPRTGNQVVARAVHKRNICKRGKSCTYRVTQELELVVRAKNPAWVDPDKT